MRKLNSFYFYLFYFILNIINAYILISGVFHPNLSGYSFHNDYFISSLAGNIGMLLLVFVIGIIFFRSTRARINFLTIFSVIFTILCVGLAIFTNIFSTFFKFSHLESFQNPSQSKYIMFYAVYALRMLVKFTQFIHLTPLFLLLFLRLFINKDYQTFYSPKTKVALLFLSLVLIITPNIKLNKEVEGTIYENSINGIYSATVTGVYNYLTYDLVDYLTTDEFDADMVDKAIEKFLQNYQLDSYENSYTRIAEDKNLLFIQLEAFNNFLIDLVVIDDNGNEIEITPNLNKLAKTSLYYDNFYSSAGIGNTSDSEFSALTGLYGNGNDLTMYSYSGDNYETLAKDFNKIGYDTFSFHGNVGDFYHRNELHITTLGFEKHYDLEYFQAKDAGAPLIHGYLDDQYFFRDIPNILKTKDKFFGYAIAVTSHSPYVPTKEIQTYDFNSLTALAKSYLEFSIHVDTAIGILIDEMENAELLDETIIVFFGDHTSSLFIEDLESIFEKDFAEAEFRKIMQNVPLIIHNENLFSPEVNHKVSATVDLPRTMANLFGIKPKFYFGSDLFSDEESLVYSPRSLDIIGEDFMIFYPSKKIYGNQDINKEKYIELFENYKYYNDLILKTKYFC